MDKIRSVIIKLFDSGFTKPSSIHQQLRNQQNNKLRKVEFGVVNIIMKVLNESLKEHSVIPLIYNSYYLRVIK
jgi:hypothetical protein